MRPTAEPTRPRIEVAATAWFVILVGSVVGAMAVTALSGHSGEDTSTLPFSVTALSLLAQWLVAFVVLFHVSQHYLTGHLLRDYALRFRPIDALGVPIGILAQLVLLELLYWPLKELFEGTFSKAQLEKPARELTDRADGFWKVVLVLAVVVGAPLVEETLYRGLLLRSLDARLADLLALVVSAAWFAAAHFQGVQFLGLFAFGIVLGTCVQRTGRLGMAILTHAAFNATSIVLLW